jgi:peptidoglycan-associated lipoprotein
MMRTRWILSQALLGTLLILACRKPQPVKAPEPKTESQPANPPQTQNDEEARRKAEEAQKQAAMEAAKRAEAERLEAYKRAAEKALQDTHFDFDQSDILAKDKPVLQGIADFMKTYPAAKLQIEGHCDERGTVDYNLGLGDRRATAVKNYLVGLGVEAMRMDTTTYGKEKPLCTEHVEDCWYRNRRAHFVLK